MSEYFVAQWFERILRLVFRAKRFQYAQLEDIGLDEIIRLAIATEGFGLLGERAPLDNRNIEGLTKMRMLVAMWIEKLRARGYTDEQIVRRLMPALKRLLAAEARTYARSFTERSVLAPLSEVLARTAIRLEKQYAEEAGMVMGGGEGPRSAEAETRKSEE